MKPEQTQFIFDSYKLLEDKLEKILGSLPLSKENEKAWSPDLVSLFVEIGSLLDSLSRTLLGGSSKLTVNDFEKKLYKPINLLKSNIVFYNYPLVVITPFKDYRKTGGWWFIYNKLKHNRIEHYEQANLINALNALGSLFLMLTRYSDEEFTKALHRRQWLKTSWVPEFVHRERLNTPQAFWCDSSLFGGGDDPNYVPANLSIINPAFASSKFQRYFGRFNP